MFFTEKSPLYVLRHRNFRLIWIGLLISRIGSEMQVVAVNWHVYLLTGSAISLGLIGLSRFLPIALFSFIGGIAADKYDRKKVMLYSQILMVFSTLILVISNTAHIISPLYIYIAIGLTSLASTFDNPARQSVTPHLVPKDEFVKAVSLNSIMWQIAIVVGPALSGFIIAYFGVGIIYALNALSFLAVVFAVLRIDYTTQDIASEVTFSLKAIKESLSYVYHSQLIFSTMLLDFFATFFASATTLMPIVAKEILHTGPKGLGFLYAAPAVGAISAGLFLNHFHTIKNQGKILLIAVSLFGISMIIFGASKIFIFSLFLLAISGFGDGISTVIRNTVRQLATPDYIRGRMVGVNQVFFSGGPQLGEVEAGLVAGMFGTPFAIITGGVATVFVTIMIAYLSPKLRKYQGHEHLGIV